MNSIHQPNTSEFWQALDTLLSQSALIIDRPAGSSHPRYPDMIYPLDYGYLAGTSSMDGGGIDVWRGSDPAQCLDSLLVSVDLRKKDAEIKLLIGCTQSEKAAILGFHNQSEQMKGMLIERGTRP